MRRKVEADSKPKGVFNKLGGFMGSIGIGIPLSTDDEAPETEDISEEDLKNLYDMLNEDEKQAVNKLPSIPFKPPYQRQPEPKEPLKHYHF